MTPLDPVLAAWLLFALVIVSGAVWARGKFRDAVRKSDELRAELDAEHDPFGDVTNYSTPPQHRK